MKEEREILSGIDAPLKKTTGGGAIMAPPPPPPGKLGLIYVGITNFTYTQMVPKIPQREEPVHPFAYQN